MRAPYHTIYKTSHLNIFRMNTENKNTQSNRSLCLIYVRMCVPLQFVCFDWKWMNERRSFCSCTHIPAIAGWLAGWLVAISCAIVTEKFQPKHLDTHHYYVSIWRTIFVESRANTTFNVDSAYIIWHGDIVLVHHFTRERERKTLFDKLLADFFCMHNAQLNIKLQKNGKEREKRSDSEWT